MKKKHKPNEFASKQTQTLQNKAQLLYSKQNIIISKQCVCVCKCHETSLLLVYPNNMTGATNSYFPLVP